MFFDDFLSKIVTVDEVVGGFNIDEEFVKVVFYGDLFSLFFALVQASALSNVKRIAEKGYKIRVVSRRTGYRFVRSDINGDTITFGGGRI